MALLYTVFHNIIFGVYVCMIKKVNIYYTVSLESILWNWYMQILPIQCIVNYIWAQLIGNDLILNNASQPDFCNHPGVS